MKKITAIIASESKTLEEFKNRPIWNSLESLYKLHPEKVFNFFIVKNNKKGLSTLYNEFLNKKEYEKDILLFVHDDVEIEDLFLVEKLNDSPYVVSGLAGCNQIDLAKPPAWHLMSDRNSQLGEVSHTKEGKVWTTVFGPTKGRALLIDGLFIAVNVEKALEKQIKFDEEFDFHHYDLAFCLDCNSKKASVGVIPIRVVHHGLGDSMLTPEWNTSSKKFREKFLK